MRDIVRSEEHCDTFVSLGLKPEYFGTHSIRKGAITHAACGVTVSPPIASICIRANWKMTGVMNRYIRFESAGDMYVGKSVCGRDRMGEEFAESCPYFDFSDYEPGEKERHHQIIDAWIRSRMHGGMVRIMMFSHYSNVVLPRLSITGSGLRAIFTPRVKLEGASSGTRPSLLLMILPQGIFGTRQLTHHLSRVCLRMFCTCHS
jgi:hypothetical protein